jgi:UDP-2,3-diacylglucosamine hydrolase
MPLTAQRFFDFCEKDTATVEAVFILGDLFEYWIGDDASTHSPFLQEVKRALATLSTKTKTYYMHGNRDFLVGNEFLKKTGMASLPDPTLVESGKQPYLLTHGDALCTADIGYQLFRHWVRKAWLQKIFLSMPLKWRRSIANHLRSNSHAQYQIKSARTSSHHQIKTDVTLEGCAEILRKYSSKLLIHGHTHLPNHHHESLGDQSWQRWVLSDWDLDHPEGTRPRAAALLVNQAGVHTSDLVKT